MPGTGDPITLGPWLGGLNNVAGVGDNIDDKELFDIVNLEVDLDGSLANRPAIHDLPLSGVNPAGLYLLGTYNPDDGRKFLVLRNVEGIIIINANSGTSVVGVPGVDSVCTIQYANKLFVIPLNGATNGGYFSVSVPMGVPAWTADATLPAGESAVIYKERMFIAPGISATTNTSRIKYSNAGVLAWSGTGTGFVDIEPGNGQKLVFMISLNNDIIVFKEHSTFRYGYTAQPAQAEVSKISSTIGVPQASCAVPYDNNSIYVLHDNSVYELYNFLYNRLSNTLNLEQELDTDIRSDAQYALTIFRNRLFVRYYANLYVYNLLTKSWSRWVSAKKFSRIFVIPNSTVGLDTAYTSTVSVSNPGKVYWFQDDRIVGVGSVEQFNCSIVTKTYDFDLPAFYKLMFYWDLVIATNGNTTCTVLVPNIGENYTWDELAAFTWDYADANITWDGRGSVIYQKTVNAIGGQFGRKTIKNLKKMRFKQAWFEVSTQAITNDISSASVRIYQAVVFLKSKQHLVKEVT